MTYPTFLIQAGLEANKTTLTSTDKQILTHFINQGLAELWTAEPHKIWPWAADTYTATLASYVFAHSAIDNSRLFTVWEADPRPLWAADTYYEAAALPATVDGTNVRVRGESSTSSAFVIFLKELPSFDYVADAASVADLIPDQAVRYLLAFVARRAMEQNTPSQSEQLLERALARESRELNKLVDEATPTWMQSPWLDWWATYQNRNATR